MAPTDETKSSGGLMPTENDLALLRQKQMANARVQENEYKPKNRKEKRAMKSKRYQNKVEAAKARGEVPK
jgi:hypothetical protein